MATVRGMGKLLVLALVAGCAGEDPHELGVCDSAWGNVVSCEAACEAGPTMETGFGMCRTGMAGPLVTYCPKANERDGGCCVVMQDHVRWYECLP